MAVTAMMRVRKDIRDMLRSIAQKEDVSMQDVLARALEAYRRQSFLEETNRAFAALKADPVSWSSMQQEQRTLDGTLMDGLSEPGDLAGWRQ
ncbi:MAG: toxin-antitoxin system protein [Chloroflexota bacterium]